APAARPPHVGAAYHGLHHLPEAAMTSPQTRCRMSEVLARVAGAGLVALVGAAALSAGGGSTGLAAGRGAPRLGGEQREAAGRALAQMPRLVILDVPYADVWAATLRALAGYPIGRAAEGVIVIDRVERDPRSGEEARFVRVAERITVRVDAFGAGSTRIAVEVMA